jgi:Spy/CpxP family protein refolding chaperone
MRRVQFFVVLTGVLFGPAFLGAQTSEGSEALEALLYPPELIMQHRRAIQLTDEQRDAITRMIEELQGRVVGLQWRLLDEVGSLTEALERPRVDQDRALDRLETVLDTEKEVKRVHLELLIRIKNVLTPEQQEMLDRLRAGDATESMNETTQEQNDVQVP